MGARGRKGMVETQEGGRGGGGVRLSNTVSQPGSGYSQ